MIILYQTKSLNRVLKERTNSFCEALASREVIYRDSIDVLNYHINTLNNQLNYQVPTLWEEFSSPDARNSGKKMDEEVAHMIERLRANFDASSIHLNSAYRTRNHNQKVGGSNESAHMAGRAVDISTKGSDGIPSDEKRMLIIKYALDIGFNRIGIHNNFVHVEYSPTKKETLWLY